MHSLVVKLLALFDKDIKTVIPDLNERHLVENTCAKEVLGIRLDDLAGAVYASAKSVPAFRSI